MTSLRRWRAALLFALGLASAPTACDTGGLVGGECRVGSLLCSGTCVNPGTDPLHCGSCEHRCGAGLSCVDARCVDPNAEGGAPATGGGSGSDAGGASGDGGAADAGAGGTRPRGGSTGAGGGSNPDVAGAGGGPCVPPFNTPEHCGACDTPCQEPRPWCVPDGADSYVCSPSCPDDYTQCGDECVDTQTSPTHCGRCFNVCPSLRCIDGKCAGATPGHVAVYCMNYSWVQQRTAHTRLLGNAFFLLPPNLEVRILAFTRFAPAIERAQVNRVIGWEALRFGRSYTLDAANDAEQVTSTLNIKNYDVFLMYEQPDAPSGALATLGTDWKDLLEEFTIAGGVVIVLDGAQGSAEMPSFISSSGLFPVDDHAPIAIDDITTDFFVQSSTDSLASTVVSPLSPAPYSCTFETSASPSPEVSFVLSDAEPPTPGRPVVIHRVVAP